jgi:hypothetical protein
MITHIWEHRTHTSFPPDKELDPKPPNPHINIIINIIIIIIIIVIGDFFRCAAFLPDKELSNTL